MGSVPFGSYMLPYGYSGNLGFGGGGVGGGLVSSSPLVLGEGVGVSATKLRKREGDGKVCDVRAAMALRSHCEAERRRRERINSHLDSLRSFVPTATKLDKATLLAEVIGKVKELKAKASEASAKCTLPSDSDEVRVEDMGGGSSFILKATICCEDRPEVLADLKQTLKSLELRVVGAEISSLGGRVKNVLLVAGEGSGGSDTAAGAMRRALQSVLDRVNSEVDFDPRPLVSAKRRRVSHPEESISTISSV